MSQHNSLYTSINECVNENIHIPAPRLVNVESNPGPNRPAALRFWCDNLADGLERRPSSISNAGLGIFTTRNIPKGTPVCYYAGYEKKRHEITPVEATYAISNDPMGDSVLVGYMYQRRDQRGGVAQLINDPFAPNVLQGFPAAADAATRYRYLGQAFAEYIRRSSNEANVEDLDFVFFTKRDILAGEELLWSYGISYWLGRLISSRSGAEQLLRSNVFDLLRRWLIADEMLGVVSAGSSGTIVAAQRMEALGRVMADEAAVKDARKM